VIPSLSACMMKYTHAFCMAYMADRRNRIWVSETNLHLRRKWCVKLDKSIWDSCIQKCSKIHQKCMERHSLTLWFW
jgi:hypothetical protein